MTNGEKFKSEFGIYATEFWAMSEDDFLKWLKAKAEPIVRCKDCVYYEQETDDPHKSNCQRLWGGMIECKPESFCSDGITVEDYKKKMALRVNALMDEVEE